MSFKRDEGAHAPLDSGWLSSEIQFLLISRWCRIIRDLRHIHVHEPASVSTCFHITSYETRSHKCEAGNCMNHPENIGPDPHAPGILEVLVHRGCHMSWSTAQGHRRHTSIWIIHDLTRCIHPKRQTYIGRHLAFGHGRVGTRVCSVCLGIDLTWVETEKRSGYFFAFVRIEHDLFFVGFWNNCLA